jgi:hypothetical protein
MSQILAYVVYRTQYFADKIECHFFNPEAIRVRGCPNDAASLCAFGYNGADTHADT